MADSTSNNPPSPKPKRASIVRRAPRSPVVTITVPQDIIDSAERNHSRHCMIAETISKTIPRAAHVVVDAATIRWTDPDKGLRYTYLTPQIVREAIVRFDRGKHVTSFSFNLRGAYVRSSRQKDVAKKRIPSASWQKIKERLKEIRTEKGIEWKTIADEIGIAEKTLGPQLSPRGNPPSSTMDKIEAWVLEQTGETPVPRIKTQADQVAGPARFRSHKSTKRDHPEIIGGAPLPVSAPWRQFGLRMFVAE